MARGRLEYAILGLGRSICKFGLSLHARTSAFGGMAHAVSGVGHTTPDEPVQEQIEGADAKGSSFSDLTFRGDWDSLCLIISPSRKLLLGKRRGIFRMSGRRFLKHFWPPAIF
jgi:hypothetical protein